MEMKEILVQYADLLEEQKDLQERIQKARNQLKKIEEGENCVVDTVQGSTNDVRYAPCLITIRGVDSPGYSRKRSALREYIVKLENLERKILEQLAQVQEYIERIENSRIRRIFTYRYIDNLKWYQVAQQMGGKCTVESVRKEHDRFLEKK